MTTVKKVTSYEIVSKTNIKSSAVILNKSILPGVRRLIYVSSADLNTVIREYTKEYDLIQTATQTGGTDAVKDWDDNTACTVGVNAGVAETDWITFDIGSIKTFILHAKIGASLAACKVYTSEDGTTWTEFTSASTTGTTEVISEKNGLVTARYVKITYASTSTSGGLTAYAYTIEAFEAEDSSAKAVTHINEDTLTAIHEVTTHDEKVTVCIFTSDANYRIVDIDDISEDIIEVNVE